ncbi:MAG: single-stranded-DNA-specific exonuclease RecJ [Pseudomonadota bacterium]
MGAALSEAEPALAAQLSLPSISTTASGKLWRLREADEDAAEKIAREQNLDHLIARALSARGVKPEFAAKYLNPSLKDSLPDPYVLADMERAAETAADAIQSGRNIGVFGDYDVDGTTAASLLYLFFRELGRDVPVYLPDRILEGYGPSASAFSKLKEAGAELVFTVDCGAAAEDAIKAAAREGLDIIVLDHHLMHGPPPANARAVVNPNRADDRSGLNDLSAAGVAVMFMVALNRVLRERGFYAGREEPHLLRYLDLVALGLVCDVMPMTGLARVLTAQGLRILGSGGNQGLRSLGARAGMKGNPSTYHLGFLLGPRINAAGRIGSAQLAFDLMTTPDNDKRALLAEKLHLMNAERQEVEAQVQADAISIISGSEIERDEVIVVAGEGWHPGVVGIVAGRLKEIYGRPAVVIGLEGDIGKGSGRSISGVDLGRAIASLKNDGQLISGGGHAMAAGLTIARDEVDALRAALNATIGEEARIARQNQSLLIDAVVSPLAISARTAFAIDKAGPFGPGNTEPVFTLTDLRAADCKLVGGAHLSVRLESRTGEIFRAIAFRAEGEPLGEILRAKERFHVAGRIKRDDWRGGEAGQLQIVDAARP